MLPSYDEVMWPAVHLYMLSVGAEEENFGFSIGFIPNLIDQLQQLGDLS